MDKAQTVVSHFQFVVLMAAGVISARQMAHAIHSHIQNVEYLIEKMKEEKKDTSDDSSNIYSE